MCALALQHLRTTVGRQYRLLALDHRELVAKLTGCCTSYVAVVKLARAIHCAVAYRTATGWARLPESKCSPPGPSFKPFSCTQLKLIKGMAHVD